MRLRREEPLDPAVVSELEAIDRALRGTGFDEADPELAELGRLAFELRAERPVPGREFAAELDRIASDGFAAADPPTPAKRRPLVRRPRVALGFGAAATIFIAVTAALSSGVFEESAEFHSQPAQRTETPSVGAPESAPPAAARDSAGSPGSAGGALTAPPPAPRPQGIAPRARNREQERQASLTLATPRDKVEQVADDVIATTDRHRGFVLSSSVSSGDRRAGASLDLRIPAKRLQPALADLSELAHVRARTQSSLDVTAAVSSLRERLRDALAERRSLLNRLEQATTDSESASLRARLRIVNRRIGRVRVLFRAQRNRVDYATVAVAVEADANSGGDGAWSPADALDDAGNILGTSLAVTVVALAVLLPVSLLLLLAWVGVRQGRRRLREQALDGQQRIEKPPFR